MVMVMIIVGFFNVSFKNSSLISAQITCFYDCSVNESMGMRTTEPTKRLRKV